MSQNAMTHISLTDDDGSGTTGTILNNSLFDSVQDNIDTALQQVVQTKSGNYTVVVTDDVVICTATLTLQLYAVSGNSGRALRVMNTSASGVVTLDGNGGETIDGVATVTIPPGGWRTIRCNGSAWITEDRSGISTYPTTVADVAGTTTQTTTASFTMPANEMRDGDVLEFDLSILAKNNKGSTGAVTVDFFWGSSSITGGNDSWSDDATERKWLLKFFLARVGADIWVRRRMGADAFYHEYNSGYLNLTTSSNVVVISSPTFNSAQTVAIKITFDAASANFYWKTQSARVRRFPNG